MSPQTYPASLSRGFFIIFNNRKSICDVKPCPWSETYFNSHVSTLPYFMLSTYRTYTMLMRPIVHA